MTLDMMTEYKTVIVLGVFLLLFALERKYPVITPARSLKKTLTNLAFWPFNIGASLLIILPISYWASTQHLWERPEWLTGVAGLAFSIIMLDLFIYWWHRANHEIQFLWRFHEVHHLDETLDTTTAIRFHFIEIIFSAFARAIVILLCATPLPHLIAFEALVLTCSLFHHSNISLPPALEKKLSTLIITPSIHWVHHHAVRKDTDSHYGTIFSFWDRLFASTSATTRHHDMPLGVEGKKDTGFTQLLTKPFS